MTLQHLQRFFHGIYGLLPAALFLLLPIPAGAGHLAAPTHYISVEFDLEAHSLRANSRIELPAGLALRLDLSSLNVARILVNGQPSETGTEKTFLDVPASAREQEILVSYSRDTGPGPDGYNLISDKGVVLVDNWYPVADHEMFFKLTAHIPRHFEAVSEADEIIAFEINENRQVTFRFPHPLFAINFIAGPYVVSRESFGDGKSLVAYFFPEDRELAAQYLARAKQYLARYEEMLGPYPYKRFAIVENRLPTGFAMPSFTLLGQSVVRLPFIVDTSLGHEILHAWFGNGVRMSPREGNWAEGLTTYLADQAFAADKGRGPVYRQEQLVKYQSYVRPEMNLTLRGFSNVGHGNTGAERIRAVGYNKSSMFFHMLRNRVGTDIFTAALRDFYKRAVYRAAGWTDLLASFESVAGLELEDFFAQWLDRSDVPELAVQELEITHSDGYPLIRFSIVQKNDPPYLQEVPVVIITAAEEIRKNLQLSGSRSHFEIPVTAVPRTMVIDPEYDLMRLLAPGELPPTWSRFLGAEKKTAVLPAEEDRGRYASLLAQLEEAGIRILLQDEVSNEDLAADSLLFLGTGGNLSRSLFADPGHPEEGFTLDVRANPLNPSQVAVLVSGANAAQVELAAAKLRHYRKYSFLSFQDGRIRDKRITNTEAGIRVKLVSLPAGIETDNTRTFDEIVAGLLDKRVVYIGEGHTSYEDHLLQLEIIRALHAHDPRLAIGMEMFPRQSQAVLDRYVAGEIDEKTFLKESHYFQVWRYDYRLYRDILSFARHNQLPVIGLNLEKEIVNQVFRQGGGGGLDEEQAERLPPDRKLDEAGYRERLQLAYIMHRAQSQQGNFSGFLQAQALWDETMAEAITAYLEAHPEDRMVVIAGRGHVDRVNAIPPRVARRLPVSQAVVANSIGLLSEYESADYLFFSPGAALSPFPLLGVILQDTEEETGVLVTGVDPKGNAVGAGIREKDIILALDSVAVNDVEDLKIEMLYKVKNEAVSVRVRRRVLFGTREIDVAVPLQQGRQPAHRM